MNIQILYAHKLTYSSSNKTFIISPKNPAKFIRIFGTQIADNGKT